MTVSHPLITLITDFGLADEYVGVIKGVILGHNAAIRLVDISHAVPPQEIRTAAHLLIRAYSFFPLGTVHLVVVDPGVGTDRPILAIRADGHTFVGPDNGVFTPIFQAAKSLTIHRITESNLFLAKVSNTFHGRDIMAPVAAQLATGLAIDKVGPPMSPTACQHSAGGICAVIDGVLTGEITHVDRFGNLCTNISWQEVEFFCNERKITIQLGEDRTCLVDTICSSYTGRKKGGLLALYDSQGLLEIAENKGSASHRLQLSAGCPVYLFCS